MFTKHRNRGATSAQMEEIMQIQASRVFVTGSNRGIGRALVEELLARGASSVYAAARDPKALASLAERSNGRLIPVRLDITNAADIRAAAAQVSTLDLLINNAGVLGSRNILDNPLDAIERDMQTNYFGTLAVTRSLLPAIERGQGAIANVLTVAALASMPFLGGYSASKAAALSFTQALRGELSRRGLQVFAVFPGPVDTDMGSDIEIPKTPAVDVARAILDGIERGEEDIFPDPMASQIGALYANAPKSVEKRFAAM
jgi:NAD(P)-dependent dehydrogenase (short-subunit alcohol dehydrogenase family)